MQEEGANVVDMVKSWVVVILCVLVLLGSMAAALPWCLDHWDKARTRIEIQDMEADAAYLRSKRLEAGITGRQ